MIHKSNDQIGKVTGPPSVKFSARVQINHQRAWNFEVNLINHELIIQDKVKKSIAFMTFMKKIFYDAYMQKALVFYCEIKEENWGKAKK